MVKLICDVCGRESKDKIGFEIIQLGGGIGVALALKGPVVENIVVPAITIDPLVNLEGYCFCNAPECKSAGMERLGVKESVILDGGKVRDYVSVEPKIIH